MNAHARTCRWMGWGLALGLLLPAGGCARFRVTDPGRTATEQFLMTEAAVRAVEQLSFAPLRGRKVYMDTTYFRSQEQEFVLGQVRAQALEQGVQFVPLRDEAQVVMEVRSGGLGIDRYDFLFGLPQLILTGEGRLGGDAELPILTPELAIVKNIDQKGYASLAYVAYWRETGDFVAASGPALGRTVREDWWFFGFGPRTVGNIPPARDEGEAPRPTGSPQEDSPPTANEE